MKTLVLILTILGLTACGQKGSNSVGQASGKSFHFEVRQVDAGQPLKGRFYFTHGAGQTIADLKTDQWARMGDFMHAENFEVVYIGWPRLSDDDMANQGADYVARFQGWIFALNDTLNTQRPVAQTFFGGMSFGGWHSVIASEVVSADAVFALEPVTRISVLTAWFSVGLDTSVGDLQNRATPANFYVSAGELDTSVDWTLTQALYGNLPNYHQYPGEIHAPYADQFDDAMAWLSTQII